VGISYADANKMNDDLDTLLFDDDILSMPKVSGLGGGRQDLEEFIDAINLFGAENYFNQSVWASDLNVISDSTSLFLEAGDRSFNLLSDHTSAKIIVGGGEHTIFQSTGELQLRQTDGDATIYLDDLSAVSGKINLNGGTLTLLVNDEEFQNENIYYENGFIVSQNGNTALEIDFDETSQYTIDIQNIRNGTVWSYQNSPETNDMNIVATDSGSLSPDTNAEFSSSDLETFNAPYASLTTSEDYEILSSPDQEYDYSDFSLFSDPSHTNFEIAGFESSSTFSLSDYFYETLDEIIENSADSVNTDQFVEEMMVAQISEKTINVDTILELSSYSDLVWDSAVEIIEDTEL